MTHLFICDLSRIFYRWQGNPATVFRLRGVRMLAYIDAGTAAAIAAMATGGLAGAKVAAQSFFYGRKKKTDPEADQLSEQVEGLEDDAPAYTQQQPA